MWKCKLLSAVGRSQLIRSVVNNLLIYYMSLFKLPNVVAKKIISLERRFFWGAMEDNRKIMTV